MVRKSLIPLACLVIVLGSSPSAGARAAQRSIGIDQAHAVVKGQPAAKTTSLIASQADCPGQEELASPAEAQERAMRCMTDYARVQSGFGPLVDAPELDVSAGAKATDVLECDSFSHFACGRDFTYWMRETGYIGDSCWHAGENLAWGTGAYGTVRAIFQAWMRSPTHRHNILGDYDQLGVSLRVGELGGQTGTRIWTQHFGSRCDVQPAA